MCISCDEVLIIEHILLTCSDLNEITESHFTAQSLHVLFEDIPPEKIFNFLKEINFFGDDYWLCMCFSHLLSLVLKLYIY